MGLNIAIQKSGRLYDDTMQLLRSIGLKVNNSKDQLKAEFRGFDASALFLRNSDIPKYLQDGVVDLAVLGQNTILEKEADVEMIEILGFQKCRLSIALPKGQPYSGMQDLNGKKIATSYPNTLKAFLEENNIDASIHLISGSVEIAPSIGLADAICDLVSSGSTLFKNGLEEHEIIMKSQACLAINKNLSVEKRAQVDQLLFRIRTVLKAQQNKYILMNVPNENIEEISNVLPVLRSPTVLPLVEEGWSSLHSVISEEDFWEVINRLKELGAEGILIVPIEKMVV
ncbi:MAG: ATP phosphoribosyltransferase [Saprospiraceae bacterium]|jgi:ATP phosphoribosyltransferase